MHRYINSNGGGENCLTWKQAVVLTVANAFATATMIGIIRYCCK